MTTRIWRGDAPAVAQQEQITISAYDVATTYKATINGKTVSVVGSGGTTDTVATALYNALIASTIPEFMEISWAAPAANVITGTAVVAGKPFTLTTAVTGGTGTISNATSVTSSGPNDLNVAANWSGGVLPGAADDVYFQQSNVDCLYNLSALSAVTLTSLNILASYTGNIGLPDYTGSYYEYRATDLTIGATTVNVGDGPGSGSGRIRLNTGNVQTTVNVHNTATPIDGLGTQALRWKGVNASSAVNVTKGSVGICPGAGEVATVSTLKIGCQAGSDSDAQVYVGTLTVTGLTINAGTVVINNTVTTLNMLGGVLYLEAGTVSTFNFDGGTCYFKGTGAVSNLNIGSGAKADFSQDVRGMTVTTCDMYPGAEFYDPNSRVTLTNGIDVNRGDLTEVKINTGANRKVSFAEVT